MFSGSLGWQQPRRAAPCESNDCSVPNWQIRSCATRTANSSAALLVGRGSRAPSETTGILRSEKGKSSHSAVAHCLGELWAGAYEIGPRTPMGSLVIDAFDSCAYVSAGCGFCRALICLLSTFSNMTHLMEMNYGVFISNVSCTKLFA
jgi:hypothetical protein